MYSGRNLNYVTELKIEIRQEFYLIDYKEKTESAKDPKTSFRIWKFGFCKIEKEEKLKSKFEKTKRFGCSKLSSLDCRILLLFQHLGMRNFGGDVNKANYVKCLLTLLCITMLGVDIDELNFY